jgi:uncharacterized protein (DUF934 family)
MRKILRRREVVEDEWRYLAEIAGTVTDSVPLILPSAELRSPAWQDFRGPLGVRVGAAEKVEDLASELPRLKLVAFEFPSLGDGRGYTYARLLRVRYGFTGEVRAVGAVKRDQVFFMARAGFDSFEPAPGEDFESFLQALQRYSIAYQPGAPQSPVRERRFLTQRSGNITSVKS